MVQLEQTNRICSNPDFDLTKTLFQSFLKRSEEFIVIRSCLRIYNKTDQFILIFMSAGHHSPAIGGASMVSAPNRATSSRRVSWNFTGSTEVPSLYLSGRRIS